MDTPSTIHAEAEILYALSAQLAQPFASPDALLRAISDYPRSQQFGIATLLYIDLDEHGKPAEFEIVAMLNGVIDAPPSIGSRYAISQFPYTKLWLSSSDKPLLIGDTETSTLVDDAARSLYKQVGIKATVTIPLYFDKRWVGILSYSWNKPQAFTEMDVRIYTAFAQQIAWRVASVRDLGKVNKQVEQALVEQKKQLAEREALIQELAAAHEQAKRNEEQVRQIIEYAPQSIAMFDNEMRYLVYNRQWMTGYGLTGKEIIGKSHYEIFPEIGDDWKAIHQRAMNGIVDVNEEAPFPRADGELDWLRWDVRPWYQPDGKVGGIMMNTDVITERVNSRKERESLIRQLREASRFKDEFLAMMSHELRTPLNAMIGLLGIVLMGNRMIDQDRNMIVRARSNSERLLLLINNILDISRMEAGRLEIVQGPVALRRLAEKFQSDMSILAVQKTVAFTVDVDPSLPDLVQTDEDAINKIITNLVGNAFKFTEQGAVALKLSKQERNLVIEVRDTGIGIPAHMQEIIFESFRQADASSTRAYGGSGLGLSIVRNLCLAMQGTVKVESTPGKGSTFTVILPLELEQAVLN